MGYGTVNIGYPIRKDDFDPAGAADSAVQQHNRSGTAHSDIRASITKLENSLKASMEEMREAMVTATIQVTYNGGVG